MADRPDVEPGGGSGSPAADRPIGPAPATLIARLRYYWVVELANAVVVPVGVIAFGLYWGAQPGILTALAVPANVLLLIIGGLYWRAKLHRLTIGPATLDRLLPALDRLQRPSQALTGLAVAAATVAWVIPSVARGTGDRVLATIFAVLAALEYVNYYHRQLQHFDHGPDFRRLLAGRGLRRSQLARDLARWRRGDLRRPTG
ncbi:MAG: hypothetical protein AAGA59_16745 [Actinomycetota bacterium]